MEKFIVKFGHLSVNLNNDWGAKKCVGKLCTLSMKILADYGFG